MPLIAYPNVPKTEGVPTVARAMDVSPTASIALGLLSNALLNLLSDQSQWGIYDQSGNKLGEPELVGGIVGNILSDIGIGSYLSTYSMDLHQETRISDFPVERGSFASYNKVILPLETNIICNFSGSVSDRSLFLSQIEEACLSNQVYDITTPEATYIGFNLENYRLLRSPEAGANLLSIEIMIKEIREVEAQYSNTAVITSPTSTSPTSTKPKDSGSVQAQIPDKSTMLNIVESIKKSLGL